MQEYVVIIAIWLASAVLSGFLAVFVARHRGHSRYLLFALGFFLGLIGVVVAILVPANQSAREPMPDR